MPRRAIGIFALVIALIHWGCPGPEEPTREYASFPCRKHAFASGYRWGVREPSTPDICGVYPGTSPRRHRFPEACTICQHIKNITSGTELSCATTASPCAICVSGTPSFAFPAGRMAGRTKDLCISPGVSQKRALPRQQDKNAPTSKVAVNSAQNSIAPLEVVLKNRFSYQRFLMVGKRTNSEASCRRAKEFAT